MVVDNDAATTKENPADQPRRQKVKKQSTCVHLSVCSNATNINCKVITVKVWESMFSQSAVVCLWNSLPSSADFTSLHRFKHSILKEDFKTTFWLIRLVPDKGPLNMCACALYSVVLQSVLCLCWQIKNTTTNNNSNNAHTGHAAWRLWAAAWSRPCAVAASVPSPCVPHQHAPSRTAHRPACVLSMPAADSAGQTQSCAALSPKLRTQTPTQNHRSNTILCSEFSHVNNTDTYTEPQVKHNLVQWILPRQQHRHLHRTTGQTQSVSIHHWNNNRRQYLLFCECCSHCRFQPYNCIIICFVQ